MGLVLLFQESSTMISGLNNTSDFPYLPTVVGIANVYKAK